jgi:aspartyl-tRNA(Asn)/glutamyl-tRNA(Gln) amidotransferase subunit A
VTAAARRRAVVPLPPSIEAAGIALRNGSLTCEDLAKACIERIERLNPSVNAFITATAEHALESAARLDRELRTGTDRGPLHGIPIAHKDIYDTAGIATTLGSPLHRDRVPAEDATLVANLRTAGTVLLGKTNMTEFASDASGRNAFYGDVRNPWNRERSAGGSSSGAAAAVAAGMCIAATGSDTGGSIRIPASWCGVVGIRPTFGLISMQGAFPRARSLDCAGPLARSVGDAAALLFAMAGNDRRPDDPRRDEDRARAGAEDLRGMRLATVDDFTYRDVDPEVGDAVAAAMREFARLGAEVSSVRIAALAAGSLGHAGLFDILLYEFHEILRDEYRRNEHRATAFGPTVRANLERGAEVTQQAYRRALSDRPRHLSEFRRIFSRVDALVTPTMPMVAPLLTESPDVFDRGRQFTLPISYLGLPSISIPCAVDRSGLPIGLLIVGDARAERRILRTAAAFERAAGFDRLRPADDRHA